MITELLGSICLPGNLQIARVAKCDLKQIHSQTYTDKINELNKNKLTKLNHSNTWTKFKTTTDITCLKIWVSNETNTEKQSDVGTSVCSVMQAYWKEIKHESWKTMDVEDSELFSCNFLSPFYLGKLKKGTGFNENHE